MESYKKTKFEEQWENSGIKPLVSEGSKVRSEIGLRLFQAEFAPEVVTVKQDGVRGKIHEFGYLF